MIKKNARMISKTDVRYLDGSMSPDRVEALRIIRKTPRTKTKHDEEIGTSVPMIR